MNVSGAEFRIVGVAPPGFRGTRLAERPDLWIPIENYPLLPEGISRPGTLTDRSTRWISGTIGRLRPGQTIAQAQADMRAVSDGLQTADSTRDGRFITVEAARRAALPPAASADIRRFVTLLMGGVAATLLIACANIAGLQLARGAARRPELELRCALGARRGRLVRQLLTEYTWLALAGTGGGILIARWAMSVLAGYDGIAPADVVTLGTAAAVLVAGAGAASFVPPGARPAPIRLRCCARNSDREFCAARRR